MKRLVDIESASKKPLETHQKMRIIVGAAENNYEGWIATDKHALNLVREADWAFHFKPNTVDAILAEHVWEHLDARDAVLVTQNCFSISRQAVHQSRGPRWIPSR